MTDRTAGTRKEVKRFGILFTVVFGLIGLYLFYRENQYWYVPLLIGALFLLAGFMAYPLLRPVYLGWMKFAFVLGWINTRLLLGLFYYLVMTPIGVVLRLLGKDLLDEKLEKSRRSYWQKRESGEKERSHYERLF